MSGSRIWGWKVRVLLRVATVFVLALAYAQSSVRWAIVGIVLLLASVADLDYERSNIK